ncbi:MAG: nucleotidyltransferase domain-containing protein [Archaeoglobaceae archaeon]|nr:nucleotidyltransferase domain-containing protein [Archaeoglobaceae archaeon]MDW8118024.1 nucleotidyltransferase domain-containing protein [Archaeoglobaceae archaeon]
MERLEYFKNYRKYLQEVSEILPGYLKKFEIYVFGSILRGDYSPGLSDIDVAIVSEEFENRNLRIEIYDLLFEKYFHSPFEFHLLTRKKWEFFLRFIGKDFERIF